MQWLAIVLSLLIFICFLPERIWRDNTGLLVYRMNWILGGSQFLNNASYTWIVDGLPRELCVSTQIKVAIEKIGLKRISPGFIYSGLNVPPCLCVTIVIWGILWNMSYLNVLLQDDVIILLDLLLYALLLWISCKIWWKSTPIYIGDLCTPIDKIGAIESFFFWCLIMPY